jgi:hypothetical protein
MTEMTKQLKPEFEPGQIFETATLAIDKNGIMWWIDPEWKEIKRAFPGEALEHDEDQIDRSLPSGTIFDDYAPKKQ